MMYDDSIIKQLADNIDWENPECKMTPFFKVREALLLPSWKVYHKPTEEEKYNICKTVLLMDEIRELINAPIHIHCWIRPACVNAPDSEYHGKDYNYYVGGSKRSGHILGIAVDFSSPGENCDDLRAALVPKMDAWQFRIEDLRGAKWVHVDLKPPGPSGRFFKVR